MVVEEALLIENYILFCAVISDKRCPVIPDTPFSESLFDNLLHLPLLAFVCINIYLILISIY